MKVIYYFLNYEQNKFMYVVLGFGYLWSVWLKKDISKQTTRPNNFKYIRPVNVNSVA